MGRGRYGQMQGDERRQASLTAMDHFLDNRVAEGEIVDELRYTLRHPHLWPVTAVLMEAIRRDHSVHRIQMIYGQASFGAAI